MRRFVLGIAVAVTSFLPTLGLADDQQIADFIKHRLQAEQQKGNLKGFNVDMRVDRGVVTFEGHVSTEQQERLILTTAQQAGHLGVVKIVDDIEVIRSNQESTMAQPASYQQQVDLGQPPQPRQNSQPVPQQPMVRDSSNAPMAFASAKLGNPQMGGQICNETGQMIGGMGPMDMGMQPMGMGGMNMGGMPMGGMGMEPMSMGMGGGVAGGVMESPNLPGYAWPGYAASPNYGAVTYPKQYSPSAWPYIGPFYPYPQVPLGWRKVTLQWDDGFWFLDFHDK